MQAQQVGRDKPLRIGVDARAASEVPAGRGRYVRELLRALSSLPDSNRYLLYTRTRWKESLDDRFQWVEIPGPEGVWHWRAARAANHSGDVFLSTNSYLTAWFTRVPTALFVHDMIAFDKRYRPRTRSALIEPLTLRRGVRRACAVMANSKSSKADLLSKMPTAAPKTTVVPLAADARFTPFVSNDDAVLAKHALDTPYVLATGTLEPRKNLVRLIEAFCSLSTEQRGAHVLAVVGASGWETADISRKMASHPNLVRRLDFIPDDELPALYRQATVFCYPSLYEGFGLPVLEAMQCGTAVVTSNTSSLPEVGGSAVIYVDPASTQAISEAIAGLLMDPVRRSQLERAGVDRARKFSWRNTALETLKVLQRCTAQAK